jgi:DNA-directed RNA polymerase specialized sigma24 family protein
LRIQGYQVHEIAKQTGRSLRTVERTLQHCRQQLSAFLKNDYEPSAPPPPERPMA